MDTKVLIGIIVLIGLLVVGSVFFIINKDDLFKKEKTATNTQLYQGPVPEGYDEDYFRQTGITRPIQD